MDINDLLPLNVNRENLQDSKIIKIISNKLVRKAIEMLRKLADKDESKKEKDNGIDNKTNEVEINENGEVAAIDNDELVVDAANDAPPPQDAMTTTTADAAEEGGENNVGAKDGSDNNEADDTKGGKEWGAIRWSKPETTTKMTTKKRK